jgi:ribonuclease VapC
MFVDASVIVAVLVEETDAEVLRARLAKADRVYFSPIVAYEATLGLARATKMSIADAEKQVTDILAILAAENLPITAERGAKAIAAFERYGKGRHPAGLNMGDCFSYACAQDLDVPLLFKGDDFSKTDVLLP